jgi:TP901 family phage tail tape measure protein
MATIARLDVLLGLHAKEFVKGLQNTNRRLRRFSAQAERTGRQLSQSLTVPILAVGTAAVKMAADFEEATNRIVGLVGIQREVVAGWSDDLKALAVDVGQSPVELAQGLEKITSAGFRGAAAMDILTASAQASAAGLGSVAEVGDVVTSAVTAYGEGNLSAAKAVGILTAAAREGKAAADTYGSALSGVLGIASELEVPFADLAAAVATITRTGATAAEAVTGLRQIFAKLLGPTKAVHDGLAEIGSSVGEVTKTLQERGLLAALVELRTKAGDNTEALKKAFESVEAFNAILLLTRDNGESAVAIFKALSDEFGQSLKKAFDDTEGAAREFGRMMAALSVAAIELGEALIPIVVPLVSEFATALTGMVNLFANLPEQVQRSVIAILAFAAALGPILLLAGGIVAAVTAITGSVAAWAAGIAAGAALIIGNWNLIEKALRAAIDFLRPAFEEVSTFVIEQWRKVRTTAEEVWPYVREIVSREVAKLVRLWEVAGPRILAFIKVAWEGAKIFIGTAMDVILGIVKGAIQLMAGDWTGFRETVVQIAQDIQEGAGKYIKAFGLLSAAAFRRMSADVIASIQSIIGKLGDWLEVITALTFLDPATRKAAETALGLVDKAYSGLGSSIQQNKAEADRLITAAKELLKPVQDTTTAAKETAEAVKGIGAEAEKTGVIIVERMGNAIDHTTGRLKGGFGAAADEFLVKTQEAMMTIEATPAKVKVIPVLDMEELRRQMEEAGLVPDTGGYTYP